MRALRVAVSLLTVLPFDRDRTTSGKDLARAPLFFPVVGLFVGGALMVLVQSLRPFLAAGPLAGVALLAQLLLTGGLHLDGLADLCDGLAAGGGRERILAVMKDSRVGAFGVIGLVVVLILKYSFFGELIGKGRGAVFPLAGLLSRWAMGLAAALGRYARENGTAKPVIGQVGWKRAAGMTGMTVALAGWLFGGAGLLAALLVFLTVLAFVRFLDVKIGGLTGDALGALNEVTELLVLLAAILLPAPWAE